LEKAYAKLNVNYASIAGGTDQEAYRALTGMPIIEHFLAGSISSDKVWEIASDADKKQFIMSGSCCFKDFGNLVKNHVYTVQGVLDLQKDGKSYKKLLKMRNPWGKE
jgi:hypothetical protein